MPGKTYVPKSGPNAGKTMVAETMKEKTARHFDRVRTESKATKCKKSYSAGYIAAVRDQQNAFNYKNPQYTRKTN